MFDGYLVDRLSKEFPWIREVYRQTSGFVHLSEKHFFSTVESVGPGRTVKFRIAAQDGEVIPESAYEEAVEAFLEATRLFAQILGSWCHSKKEVAQGREGTDEPGPDR